MCICVYIYIYIYIHMHISLSIHIRPENRRCWWSHCTPVPFDGGSHVRRRCLISDPYPSSLFLCTSIPSVDRSAGHSVRTKKQRGCHRGEPLV